MKEMKEIECKPIDLDWDFCTKYVQGTCDVYRIFP